VVAGRASYKLLSNQMGTVGLQCAFTLATGRCNKNQTRNPGFAFSKPEAQVLTKSSGFKALGLQTLMTTHK